jgi:hypothetical protein
MRIMLSWRRRVGLWATSSQRILICPTSAKSPNHRTSHFSNQYPAHPFHHALICPNEDNWWFWKDHLRSMWIILSWRRRVGLWATISSHSLICPTSAKSPHHCCTW